jgi:hypothetical protein
MITIDEPYAAYFGANFDRVRGAFDFEVFYHRHGVTISQRIANAIAHNRLGNGISRPFMATFGAVQQSVHLVGEGTGTIGTWGEIIAHEMSCSLVPRLWKGGIETQRMQKSEHDQKTTHSITTNTVTKVVTNDPIFLLAKGS